MILLTKEMTQFNDEFRLIFYLKSTRCNAGFVHGHNESWKRERNDDIIKGSRVAGLFLFFSF